MKKHIARLMPWWMRLSILALVGLSFADVPYATRLAIAMALFALALVRPDKQDDRPPQELDPPLRGTWAALNSPATKVPSHGLRAYGQSHALDLLHPKAPGERTRPGFGLGLRAPGRFSSFGEPVFAMEGGEVVATCGWQRDHLSRQGWLSIAYLLTIESVVRELFGGPRFVLGNHVVVDHGDGTYAAYAHLRRGSVTVAVGDKVAAGDQLGAVGNSGNTTEPHLHVQLMDDPVLTAAAGLPMSWRDIRIETGTSTAELGDGIPANGQTFTTVG